ncbi:unnamed protein product [Rotaria magnacalcarata]|nr:unnamed protein product [Rotaria magnacalcarata]CAF2155335.1 unnamed protein product [Rotaria magnacalcarata]CAF3474757.1 unnamed protein product [Rotaria socialis]CAF3679050.1 unnamed protein product [Rotaria socialis]
MSDSKKAHEQVYSNERYRNDQQHDHHKSSLTHELVSAAAGFAAMKAYEDHVRRTGQHVSHPLMKEMLAGFAAAEVDKLIETKGLDFLDREKLKHLAKQQAHHIAHEQYGPNGTFNWQGDQYGPGAGVYQQQGGYGYTANQFGGGAIQQQQPYNEYTAGQSEHHYRHHHHH